MRALLFDIDGTLIDSGGAGMAALLEAAGEVFGTARALPELDLAGSTDSGVVRGLFAHYGAGYCEETERAFYDVYLGHLERGLETCEGRVLAGVVEVVERVASTEGLVVGLLTGNIARGAALKVRRFGLAGAFRFGAYGDDHHDRNRLGPVALERAREVAGTEVPAERAVVIGDTPKDIRCGQSIGATTVAVATGRFGVDELASHGADVVFEDLSDVAAVLEVLVG